jgi:hypothetical protein
MAGYYTVQQGDCLANIAKMAGFINYETIWNHSENAQLKAARPNPNILLPGDRVFVPDKELRTEDRPTDQRHRFLAHKKRVFLEIAVRVDEKPVANATYTIIVDKLMIRGTTDGDGILKQEIDAAATRAQLHFDDPPLDWDLVIGGLDPFNETSGVQQRLNNLGYSCGPADGVAGPRTRGALRHFRSRHQLTPNGNLDAASKKALQSVHDGQ